MNYPLPGETIARTLRNREFGFGAYSPDEPAPEDIALLFRGLLRRWRIQEMTRATWERRGDLPSFEAYQRATEAKDRRRNDLLRAMGHHRYRSFVCDGYRIRLVIEPDGCRRSYVSMERV